MLWSRAWMGLYMGCSGGSIMSYLGDFDRSGKFRWFKNGALWLRSSKHRRFSVNKSIFWDKNTNIQCEIRVDGRKQCHESLSIINFSCKSLVFPHLTMEGLASSRWTDSIAYTDEREIKLTGQTAACSSAVFIMKTNNYLLKALQHRKKGHMNLILTMT